MDPDTGAERPDAIAANGLAEGTVSKDLAGGCPGTRCVAAVAGGDGGFGDGGAGGGGGVGDGAGGGSGGGGDVWDGLGWVCIGWGWDGGEVGIRSGMAQFWILSLLGWGLMLG